MSKAKVISEKELKRVLKLIDSKRHSERNRCLFLMTHFCGTRIMEACSIRLQDAINADGTIKSEIRLSSAQTKGSKGRIIYVSEKMQKEIELYLKSRFKLQNLLAVTLTDTSRALFPNQKNPNRGFSPNTAAQMVNSWYRQAKVEGSSHSGRHGFLSTLASKGVQVRLLQELAGHSSLSVTQRYIQTTPQLLHKAISLL